MKGELRVVGWVGGWEGAYLMLMLCQGGSMVARSCREGAPAPLTARFATQAVSWYEPAFFYY